MKTKCAICNNAPECELLIENNNLKRALEKAKQLLKKEDICNYCEHANNERLSELCQECCNDKDAKRWLFNESLLF